MARVLRAASVLLRPGLPLTLAAALLAGPGLVGPSATADETTPVPSRQDVRDARRAAADAAQDVAGVQAALAAAQRRLAASAIAAERAEEAYNGARYRAVLAAQAADRAARRSEVAAADLEKQRSAYAEAVTAGVEMAPGLTALAALSSADGVESLMHRASALGNAQTAMDVQYQRFHAAAVLADVADRQARSTDEAARKAKDEAGSARAAARRSADAAAAQARAIAAERTVLVRRLARLQGISVATAAARQHALEERAAQEAAAQAVAATAPPAPIGSQSGGRSGAQAGSSAGGGSREQDAPSGSSGSTGSSGSSAPQPTTPPPAAPAPPPAAGADAAIAFARQQLGEPYVWGAAGPDAWDCSGLTMRAWAAGGKTLPHYSVAQYEQSTPIRASQLRPGDLVFWGDSDDASSIYHVALYIGDGRIIHAPRTGQPVQEASLYYWTAPNFYARP